MAEDVLVWIVWVIAACALLSSGIAVVLFSNPFFSALALIVNLASLAVLYLVLAAEFVAAAQVLVYAGAIAVEVVVVVALKAGDRLSQAADIPASFGSPSEIGKLFLGPHLLAFEATSI